MPGVCACYKCLVSGRSWNLSLGNFLTEGPLVGSDGSCSDLDDLLNNPNEFVGLLFSASRIPECELFNDYLSEIQNQLIRENRFIHIVYIPIDDNQEETNKIRKKYPRWFTLHPDDHSAAGLISYFSFRNFPSMALLSSAGIVTRSAGKDLQDLGTQAWRKWTGIVKRAT